MQVNEERSLKEAYLKLKYDSVEYRRLSAIMNIYGLST
jgi:hypothetical protein